MEPTVRKLGTPLAKADVAVSVRLAKISRVKWKKRHNRPNYCS